MEAEDGDLIKNLCGVPPLFLVMTGDLVLLNCCGPDGEDGDLIKNLCDVVPLFLVMIGDLVLQNCCCEEE